MINGTTAPRPDSGPRYLWRLLMTGLCFAVFGIGGLLLTGGFHMLCLVLRNPSQRTRVARQIISFSFRLFLGASRGLGVMDYRIQDATRLDEGGLILANHPTLIDYVLLASVMPRCDCVVKQALMGNMFLSGVIKAADYLVNDRPDTLLAESRKRLKSGDSLLIFPEGTRTPIGGPIKLQRGAAQLAVRSECDIRLVHIHCSQPFLSKGSKWYRIPPCKPLFSIQVGERLSASDFTERGDISPGQAARRLTRYLTAMLAPGGGQSFENRQWKD